MKAAILKHPYRPFDYRVDLFADEITNKQIMKYYELSMIGPFEVFRITEKVRNVEGKTVIVD